MVFGHHIDIFQVWRYVLQVPPTLSEQALEDISVNLVVAPIFRLGS